MEFLKYEKDGKTLVDAARFKRSQVERQRFCRWATEKLEQTELGKALVKNFGEVK